jgi:hypothetical protein
MQQAREDVGTSLAATHASAAGDPVLRDDGLDAREEVAIDPGGPQKIIAARESGLQKFRSS